MVSKEQENSKTILTIFRAIEERDAAQFRSFLQPDFEIHWPPSLPYGGTFCGVEPQPGGWGATWQPLQPTETERRMDPRVVAAHDDDVVVLWRQRGRTIDGDIRGRGVDPDVGLEASEKRLGLGEPAVVVLIRV